MRRVCGRTMLNARDDGPGGTRTRGLRQIGRNRAQARSDAGRRVVAEYRRRRYKMYAHAAPVPALHLNTPDLADLHDARLPVRIPAISLLSSGSIPFRLSPARCTEGNKVGTTGGFRILGRRALADGTGRHIPDNSVDIRATSARATAPDTGRRVCRVWARRGEAGGRRGGSSGSTRRDFGLSAEAPTRAGRAPPGARPFFRNVTA